MGLPCLHTIWERQRVRGVIRPEDIHEHWYHDRPDRSTMPIQNIQGLMLHPEVVRGKGRPKGALGESRTSNSSTISSTKRLPSAFELPSSSAPPASAAPMLCPATAEGVVSKVSPQIELYVTRFGRTATRIGMQRIQDIGEDIYEPRTAWERVYQLGMSSNYHTDSKEETAKLADKALQAVEVLEEPQETQDCIEVEV